jgi:hypothetical protein
MKPPPRETTHRGLMEYGRVPDQANARIIVDRIASIIDAGESMAQIMQRLNVAKPGRCPCCGFRADWHPRLTIPDGMSFIEQPPNSE